MSPGTMLTFARRGARYGGLAFALVGTVSRADVAQETQGPSSSLVVDVAWLADHLEDGNLVILHLGRQSDFGQGHIPHARFLSLDQISTPHGQGLMLQMPPVEQLRAAFEELGVSDDSRIVLYAGDNGLTQAARTYVTLDYLGLGSRASILDGGLESWRAAGKSITTSEDPPRRGSIAAPAKPDVVVDLAWVRSHLARADVAVVDARTTEYYRGEPQRYSRPGHIEGAYSIPFLSVTNAETSAFKSPVELRQLFRDAGVPDGSHVVTYCHIGQQASLVYFIAKYLGYHTQLYDGSFEEWSATPDAPVRSGAKR
jgi:thiosulfate/3-mercaptopyruvate sulfurtransferase